MSTGSFESSGAARQQLKSFVERVENVQREIDAANTDKSEIYKEAKDFGFDVPTLKTVVKRRKMTAQEVDEADQLLELYERALAEARGETIGGRERDDAASDATLFDGEDGEDGQDDAAEASADGGGDGETTTSDPSPSGDGATGAPNGGGVVSIGTADGPATAPSPDDGMDVPEPLRRTRAAGDAP